MINKLKEIYEKNYKILLFIPFLILILALAQIGTQYVITGDFVHKGVTLKGGSTITINKEIPLTVEELDSLLKEKFPRGDLSVRSITSGGKVVGLALDSDAQETKEIDALLTVLQQELGLTANDYNVEVMGSALGKSFFQQTMIALLIAFLLMGLVVLIYFRTIFPSLAVILAAFSDIVVTLAIFNLTGMKLSTAGIEY